jgi:hypothetical protein
MNKVRTKFEGALLTRRRFPHRCQSRKGPEVRSRFVLALFWHFFDAARGTCAACSNGRRGESENTYEQSMNKVMADIRNQSENPQAARDLLSAAADGQGRNHCHVPFTQASYSAGALPLRDAATRSSDIRDIMINNSYAATPTGRVGGNVPRKISRQLMVRCCVHVPCTRASYSAFRVAGASSIAGTAVVWISAGRWDTSSRTSCSMRSSTACRRPIAAVSSSW